jgi:predicted O-linked N-acetylglucosamine transferase (SPINDLY family)
LELRPNFAEAYSNLGLVLQGRQRLEHALACFRRVLELKPDWAEAHFNVGNVLQDEQKPEEALGFYRRALELDPAHARAHNNLGNAWKDQGNLSGAIASYRRALELQPDYVEAHSNLVYTLLFSPEHEARRIYEETCRWSEKHAEALTKSAGPHTNDRSPSRRLRVGYVSPDFRFHPVGRFLLPLLESHDHQHFEVLAYSSVRVPDAVTEECRRHVDAWRDVLALSDAELADAVRRDRIDILVDLTMHMANGRLLAFARKPAPVQVTYLAYCGTTGLRTIDYRLTDPYLDPPGQDTGIYTERSVHLPETYWCYRAPAAVPPVSPPPVLQTGRTTFGCLNNFCKVSDPALAAWGRILRTTPGSRLLLHSRPGAHRLRVGEFFQREGVAQDRVEFLELLPFEEYCRVHERIDIALDPFPYAGGTTTCDALWMGVPVVSLAGRTAVGRGGLSILSNIGLADMAARDVEEYVGLAIALAGDKDRLEKLRGTMRGRMQNSPLTDAPRFARNVEAAYRVMWQEWIA